MIGQADDGTERRRQTGASMEQSRKRMSDGLIERLSAELDAMRAGRTLQGRAGHRLAAGGRDRRRARRAACSTSAPTTTSASPTTRRRRGRQGGARPLRLRPGLGPLHLRHAGPAQGARGAARRLPRHRGHHPLLLLLRRQRRPLRDAARRGGRDHLRRAQPRLDHRRHPPLQGPPLPLRQQRHGRPRALPARGRAARASGMIATDGVFSMDGVVADLAGDLRPRRALRRDGDGRRLPRHRLLRRRRARHARALRRRRTASTSSPARSARRSAAPPAASPAGGAR